MSLSRIEQETIINYNEAEQTASVYTHNRRTLRQLEQLAAERPNECRLERRSHDGQAADYLIPKSWVKIRPTRIMTDEQREQLRERGRALASKTRFEPKSPSNSSGNSI